MLGVRVQNYELVSLIGEGGMGLVYLGRHLTTGRLAAIKVLRLQHCHDEEQVARFIDEAKAVNAIRHANIVDIVDVDRLPGSRQPYLLMELLEGEPLSARLRSLGVLPVKQALFVARQTAAAIAAAHAKGIVHRDLKPDNIFLVADPAAVSGLRVKVLDFGIAKLDPNLRSGFVRTTPGQVFGTPTYMSPEQCRGRTADIDRRSDVYSLGIVLYEMLCGRPPFLREGAGDVLRMHIGTPPLPLRTLNPDIPSSLEAVVLKALAKAPAERHQTMGEFAAALVDPPETAIEGRWAIRRWWFAAASGLLLLVCFVAIGFGRRPGRGAEERRRASADALGAAPSSPEITAITKLPAAAAPPTGSGAQAAPRPAERAAKRGGGSTKRRSPPQNAAAKSDERRDGGATFDKW